MGTATFSDFIQLLERDGELARVKTQVDPILEIAEICDRESVHRRLKQLLPKRPK